MNWLRQIPIGQYVEGSSGWLRAVDPRLKFSWVLMFLLSPILSGFVWRISLVIGLLTITFISCLPPRIWWKSLTFLLLLAFFVGAFAMFLPNSEASATLAIRSPNELPGLNLGGAQWEVFRIGPLQVGGLDFGQLIVNRRAALLGVKTSTLVFTVVHSVNLMLLTTVPEDLAWALSWFLAPLSLFGVPVDRLSFQLLLALRFIPLVQEEFQNLLRALAIRAVNLRQLGFKVSFGLILSVGERLLANILLRAEQAADAIVARGGVWLSPSQLKTRDVHSASSFWLNIFSAIILLFVLCLRGKYGAL